ncbi:MAG: CBS domain-containing protein [Acetobacteraceae bacterium]|nr:CBS domain-containing protein [Acetobacteraceae bacterium]MBV8525397.1 CBS domain-containing protein [Acetobacteraceae bacterium]
MLEGADITAVDLMTREVIVAHPETTLLEAVKLMAQNRISGMPVLDHSGNLVGLITEGDLVRWHEGYTDRQARWLDMLAEGSELASSFLERIHTENHKVNAVMSRNVTTVTEEIPAHEIASLMCTKNIKRVPVMRNGKLVGIVARSDLVRALAQPLAKKPAPIEEPETVEQALRHAREEAVERAHKPARETPSAPPRR